MFARKESKKQGEVLPLEWLQQVQDALNKTYAAECQQQGKSFEVYGLNYEEEFLLIASFLDTSTNKAVPTTCFISIDTTEKDKRSKTMLTKAVDALGVFFDLHFEIADWSNYPIDWEEAEFQKLKFFYRISRENISLALQAEHYLKN